MPYYHRYDKVNHVFIIYERENEYAREYEVCRCTSQWVDTIESALNARASLMRALGLKDAE